MLPYFSIFYLFGFDSHLYVLLSIIYLFRHKNILTSTFFNSSKMYFSSITYFIHVSVLRLIRVFIAVILIGHYIACLWLIIKLEPAAISKMFNLLEISQVYLDALYWSITTITTVGYGDITPILPLEKLYTIMVMMLGVGIYGYIIGNVSYIINSFDISSIRQHENLYMIKQFIHCNKLSLRVEKKILESGAYFGEMSLFGDNTYRSKSIQAITYCSIYELSKDWFQDIIKQYPKVAEQIKKEIIRRKGILKELQD